MRSAAGVSARRCALDELGRLLGEHDLLDASARPRWLRRAAQRLAATSKLVRRLRRRVLARQVRADQRDLLRRHRPAHAAGDAGAHDDVPGRAGLRRGASRRPARCCRSRPGSRAARWPSCAHSPSAWPRIAARSSSDARAGSARRCARSRARECVAVDEARALGFWDDDAPDDNPPPDDDGRVEVPALAPCADQLSASAARARPGGARHAGPERDRRRARTDARPAAVGACDGVHPRRRHRRDAAPTSPIWRDHLGAGALDALRGAEQDRHAARSARHAAAGARADRAAAPAHGADARRRRWSCVFPLSARQALAARIDGDDAALRRQPPARTRARARRRSCCRSAGACSSRSVLARRAADRGARGAPPRRPRGASSPSRRSSCAACAARAAPSCA